MIILEATLIMLEDIYELRVITIPDPVGQRTENRVIRRGYDEDIWYIQYNKAANTSNSYDWWMWTEWFAATVEQRQQWYKKMRVSLAPISKVPCVPAGYHDAQQEGINPMCKTTSTDVSINMQTAPSDTAKAREFLLKEFSDKFRYSWDNPTTQKLRKLYNLDAPTIPETSQEIIDAFKNGRVEIDQEKVDKQTKYFAARDSIDDDDFDYEDGITNRYFGVKFLDLPVADRKGFDAAFAAFERMKEIARRKIAVLDPEAGLQVLLDLEDWKPTAPTVH